MDPITAGIGLISTIVSSIFPNATDAEKAKLQLELEQNEALVKLLTAQTAINQAEASSSNLFVSGWRPSIGWVCSLIFCYNYLIQPLLLFLCAFFNHPVQNLPVLNTGDIMPVLLGMLGLAGARTYEKVKDVNNKHK